MNQLLCTTILLPPKTHIKVIQVEGGYHFIIYTDFFAYHLTQTTLKYPPVIDQEFNALILTSQTPRIFAMLLKKISEIFFYSWNYYFVAKFRFKGKGYRIFRRSESRFIKFFFGHSHMRYIKFRFVHLFKPHKYKFVILTNSPSILKKAILLVNKVRPKNLFTKRGIAYTRQILIKRKGKGALI